MTSVCVVVPNKNGLALLGPSLDSVLAQDFDPMSVLVVDNISSDGSYELALDYAARDARVTVVQNDVDVNYYGSLNRALATTTAEYLVPFANDDFMEPGNLTRKVALLEQTGAGFAHSSARRIDGGGRTIDVCPDHFAIPEVLGAGEFVPYLVPFNCVNVQSAVIRVEALRSLGGWDPRTIYAADWLAFGRMAMRWRVVTIADPLLVRREHSSTGTSSADALGIEARDVGATLDAMIRDPAAAPALAQQRRHLLARVSLRSAQLLDQLGRHRLSGGWSAPMMALRAMALLPEEPACRQAVDATCGNAGLAPPAPRFRAVAPAPADARQAEELVAAAAELAPACAELVVVASGADQLSRAESLLAPVVPESFDVQLTEGAFSAYLQQGVLAVAPWASAEALTAEAAGIATHVYGVPNAFGSSGDPFENAVNPFDGERFRLELMPDPYYATDPYGAASGALAA